MWSAGFGHAALGDCTTSALTEYWAAECVKKRLLAGETLTPAEQAFISRYQAGTKGKSSEEIDAMLRAGQTTQGPNWLLWGGIAAGVAVVGYLVFFRR